MLWMFGFGWLIFTDRESLGGEYGEHGNREYRGTAGMASRVIRRWKLVVNY